MDPAVLVVSVVIIGFPRTRGDGPEGEKQEKTEWQFPPHARGWTDWKSKGCMASGVSPARAGMDRSEAWLTVDNSGFPRTRGDGPYVQATHRPRTRFPRTRGDGPAPGS